MPVISRDWLTDPKFLAIGDDHLAVRLFWAIIARAEADGTIGPVTPDMVQSVLLPGTSTSAKEINASITSLIQHGLLVPYYGPKLYFVIPGWFSAGNRPDRAHRAARTAPVPHELLLRYPFFGKPYLKCRPGRMDIYQDGEPTLFRFPGNSAAQFPGNPSRFPGNADVNQDGTVNFRETLDGFPGNGFPGNGGSQKSADKCCDSGSNASQQGIDSLKLSVDSGKSSPPISGKSHVNRKFPGNPFPGNRGSVVVNPCDSTTTFSPNFPPDGDGDGDGRDSSNASLPSPPPLLLDSDAREVGSTQVPTVGGGGDERKSGDEENPETARGPTEPVERRSPPPTSEPSPEGAIVAQRPPRGAQEAFVRAFPDAKMPKLLAEQLEGWAAIDEDLVIQTILEAGQQAGKISSPGRWIATVIEKRLKAKQAKPSVKAPSLEEMRHESWYRMATNTSRTVSEEDRKPFVVLLDKSALERKCTCSWCTKRREELFAAQLPGEPHGANPEANHAD